MVGLFDDGNTPAQDTNNKSLYGSGDVIKDTTSFQADRAEAAAESASDSQVAAAASEAAASASASAASTSESNAAASAAAALVSEGNASGSEAAAASSESNAAASAAAALVSEGAAAASELAASNSATAASNSAGAAATAQTGAETAQGLAETARDAAQLAETGAVAAKNAAETAQGLAETARTGAETAETNAETAQTAAEAAQAAAELVYDTFDDRYLGDKTSDPTLDNDGNALVDGAMYFNTTSNPPVMRVYSTTDGWADVAAAGLLNRIEETITGVAKDTFVVSYDINIGVEVFLNGVKLEPDAFTAANGTSVVLNTAAEVGEHVSIIAYVKFNVADVYTKTESDTKYPVANNNLLINGDFQVWQRATSVTNPGGTSIGSADRWLTNMTGGGGGGTASRQAFAIGQLDVAGNPKYFLRIDKTLAGTAPVYLLNKHEGVSFGSGVPVTLSFDARADVATTWDVTLQQQFGTGGTPSSSVITDIGDAAVTTSWQRFEFTGTLPSIAAKTLGTDGNDSLNVRLVGLDSITGQLDLANVKLELGSVATPFVPRSYGEELALCQRYYQIINWTSSRVPCSRYLVNSGTGRTFVNLPVVMRDVPTFSQSGSWSTASGYAGAPILEAAKASNISVTSTTTCAASEVLYFQLGQIHLDAEL